MKNIQINTAPLSLFRFLAVVTVIMVHYAQGIEDLYLFPFGITRAGAIITFFFILSGFGLFLGYRRRDGIDFPAYIVKRTTRILPFYYLALFMMAALLLAAGRFSLAEFFLSFFCLQSWIPNYQHAINPPGWFVADLLFFYLVFPLIFSWIKTRSPDPVKLLLGSFLLWISSVLLLNVAFSGVPARYYNYIDCFPLSHFPSFFMGICGAYFITEKKQTGGYLGRNSLFSSLFVLLICSLIILFHQGEAAEMFETKLPFEANLFAPLYLLMIMHLSTADNYVTKILSFRFFGLLATISFPLYIFQAPVYSLYHYGVSQPIGLPPGADFLLFLVLFMLFASVVTVAEFNIFRWLRERTS